MTYIVILMSFQTFSSLNYGLGRQFGPGLSLTHSGFVALPFWPDWLFFSGIGNPD